MISLIVFIFLCWIFPSYSYPQQESVLALVKYWTSILYIRRNYIQFWCFHTFRKTEMMDWLDDWSWLSWVEWSWSWVDGVSEWMCANVHVLPSFNFHDNIESTSSSIILLQNTIPDEMSSEMKEYDGFKIMLMCYGNFVENKIKLSEFDW